MWEKATENIVFDEEIKRKICEKNPWALCKIIEKLLEAAKRGYWKADKNVIDRLKREYLEIEKILEDKVTFPKNTGI